MVRVLVLYDEEPDATAYAEHVELCRQVPGGTFRHGKVFGAPMGEPAHRYYAEWEFAGPGRVQGGGRDATEFAATGKDALRCGGLPDRSSSRRARVVERLAEARRALLAHGGDALVHVGPGHVEELERERRVERRACERAASC